MFRITPSLDPSNGRSSAPGGCGLSIFCIGFAVFLAGTNVRAQEADLARSNTADDVWELTLEEALEVARFNNPGYRRAEDGVVAAAWRQREAYGSLLPTATVGSSLRYTGAGTQLFGSVTGDDLGIQSTDYYVSDYSLAVGYSISGQQIYGLASRRAEHTAAVARTAAAAYDLSADVTARYLAALRAAEATAAARRQQDRADQGATLARARATAGAAPRTDVLQAEIEAGRAAVALVQSENLEAVELARLLEVLGLSDDRTIRLVSRFEVFPLDEALIDGAAGAVDGHPRIQALRQTEQARRADVRQAQSAYLPTLALSAGWSGFTREVGNTDVLLGQARSAVEGRRAGCERDNAISAGLSQPLEGFPRNCEAIVLTSEAEAALLAQNDVFPFDFQRLPLSVSLRVSLPVFQGFTRQRQVEEARVQARAAGHDRRAEELRVETEITTLRGSLRAAYDIVAIEARNRELAAERLTLARERYRIGDAPFLELLDAQSSAATADRDHLNAVFDFHTAIAEFERASGVDLRPR